MMNEIERPSAAQPGWYPDPSGAPGVRWFDGQQWTNTVRSAAGESSGASVSSVAVVTDGPNHALHAVLSVLTCGAWLPVWACVAIFGSRKTTIATTTAGTGR